MQLKGPEVPLQVVVWPEQVHEAGQVVSVVTLVTVIVELLYGTDVVGADEGEDEVELELKLELGVEEVGDEEGLETEVAQGI